MDSGTLLKLSDESRLEQRHERPVAAKPAVGHQHVQLRMQLRHRTERLHAHDQTRHQLVLADGRLDVVA